MNIQEAANEYHEQDGWNVIPTMKNGKTPAVDDLNRILLFPETSEDVQRLFPDNNRNVAVACGAVSSERGALNILDFENRFLGGYHRLYESNPTFRRMCDNTRRTETQSGGKHVFVETDKPIDSLAINDDSGKRIIDFQGYKKYALVPPSRIKNPYLWEHWNEKQNGKIYRASLDELNEVLGLFGKEALFTPEKRIADDLAKYNATTSRLIRSGDLSKKLYRYLITGKCDSTKLQNTKGSGPDRSRLEFMIITRFVRLGFTDETIQAIFNLYAYPGAKVRERPELLTYALQKARSEWCKSDFDKQVEEYIGQIIYMTDLSPYARTIMQEILIICRSIGRLDNVQLAQNELALRTGTAQQTISNNLKALEVRKLLSLDKRTDGIRATRFSVKPLVKGIGGITSTLGRLDIGYTSNSLKSDSYHHFALGKTGKLIVEVLNQHIGTEFSVKEVSEVTGISAKTIRVKLELLEKHSFVESGMVKGKGRPRKVYWTESSIENLLSIAIEKRTDGLAMKQERKIDGERKAYREYLKTKAIETAKQNGGEIEKRYKFLFAKNETIDLETSSRSVDVNHKSSGQRDREMFRKRMQRKQ